MKRILLADDHSIVRSGIRSLISENLNQVLIDEAETEEEIMQHLKTAPYDLVVLDISIPNTDFTRLMEYISIAFENTKMLIFSMHPEEIYGIHCLQLGAKGFLHKTASNEEIIAAITRVLDGKKYISPRLVELLLPSNTEKKADNPFKNLSARELEIAKHLNEGKSLPEICNILKIQYSTANTYKRRIFDKLKVHSILSLSRVMASFEM